MMVMIVKKFFTSFSMQVKRRFLMLARQDRVQNDLKKRRGECIGCGQCCQASFPCPFLFDHHGKLLCKIHQTKPAVCKTYPFNEQDMFPHTKERCGYYFLPDDKDEAKDQEKKKEPEKK